MILERVSRPRVRLVADPGLIGPMEGWAVVFAIAYPFGIALGSVVVAALGIWR